MKLRWFSVYDINGKYAERVLQYWDESSQMWKDVPSVNVHIRDKETAILDKEWI